jgi:restriction endonuclease S subunit
LGEAAWGAGQPNVNATKLKDLLLSFPPLTEQKRIVTKLHGLIKYCADLEESIKESQQQNELLLQQVLFEALEPKEEEVEKV